MHKLLIGVQVIIALVVIVSVLLQPSKTDGFNSVVTSGNDTFFSKNKSRTREVVLSRVTVISAIAFALVTIAINLVK